MRSGQYIHALGRRSFEPSQPATSDDAELPLPSEQSQERQRQLVKAQNDVLATVGVCLRETKSSLENRESRRLENDVGILISALDMVAAYVVSWPLVGVRNRLQAFRTAPNLRYRDVVRVAWRTQTMKQLFAGLPAHVAFQVSKLLEDFLQARFMRWLGKTKWFNKPRKHRRLEDLCLRGIWFSLSLVSWSLVYPLFYHSNLQILHLTDATPLLPRPLALIPFSSQSPFSVPVVTGSLLGLTAWKHLALQAASSHFLQSFLFTRLTLSLHAFFSSRISRVLPHPAGDARNSPGYLTEVDIDLATDEIEAELAATGIIDPIEIEAIIERDDEFTATIEISEIDIPQSRTYTATPVPADTPQQSNPLYLDQEDSENTPPVLPTAPTAPVTPGPATPVNAATQAPAQQPSSTPPGLPKRHTHRTTALAIHPVDALSMHLADCLCNATVLVLESAMLRILVRNVLNRRFMPGGDRMINDGRINGMVYRPWELAGHGLVAKAMILGEWSLNWVLFEVSWGVCWAVGRRCFGYGR